MLDKSLKIVILSTIPVAALFQSCGPKPGAEAGMELANVFGADGRAALSSTSFPGTAIGRLDGGCTAVMIGKRIALTAAHCVFDAETDRLRQDLQYVKWGYRDRVYQQKSWIERAWIGTKASVEDRKNDWALLLFDNDIGEKTGWLGLRPDLTEADLPLTVSMLGYHATKSGGEVAQRMDDCYIHRLDDKGRFLHDCDSDRGASGAPLVIRSGDQYSVVALHASELRRGDVSESRSSYSHDYANIAIAPTEMFQVVTQVRRHLAVSGAASVLTIEGVTELANLNSSVEATQPGPRQPTRTPTVEAPPNSTPREVPGSEVSEQPAGVSVAAIQAHIKARCAGMVAALVEIEPSYVIVSDYSYELGFASLHQAALRSLEASGALHQQLVLLVQSPSALAGLTAAQAGALIEVLSVALDREKQLSNVFANAALQWPPMRAEIGGAIASIQYGLGAVNSQFYLP